jgi:hypothetical protein
MSQQVDVKQDTAENVYSHSEYPATWRFTYFTKYSAKKGARHSLSNDAVNASKLCKWQGVLKTKTKLRGLSPQANYTDWATAACRRS